MLRQVAVLAAALAFALATPPTLAGVPPQQVWLTDIGGGPYASPVTVDIDPAVGQEILMAHPYKLPEYGGGRGAISCLSARGELLWRYLATANINPTPSVGDVNGDGRLEIVVASDDGMVACLTSQGVPLWRTPLSGGVTWSAPALADLERDGFLEVVIGGEDGNVACLSHGGLLAWLRAFGADVAAPPGLADVNGDGMVEVLVPCDDQHLYCLSHRGELLWSLKTVGSCYSGPVAADLEGDGEVEVLTGSDGGGLYCVRGKDGTLKFNVPRFGPIDCALALADVNGDEKLECVLAASEGTLAAVSASGEVLWRSTGAYGRMDSAPVVGDVDGDGALEVVVGDRDGHLICLSSTGEEEWVFEQGGDAPNSPALADLDEDGKVEIICTNRNGAVFCLTAGGQYSVVNMPWPMRRHDLWQTGALVALPPAALLPAPEVRVVRPPFAREDSKCSVRLRLGVAERDARVPVLVYVEAEEPLGECEVSLEVRDEGRTVFAGQRPLKLATGVQAADFCIDFPTPWSAHRRLTAVVTDERGNELGQSEAGIEWYGPETIAQVQPLLEKAARDQARLRQAIEQARAAGITVDYPLVTATVVDRYLDWIGLWANEQRYRIVRQIGDYLSEAPGRALAELESMTKDPERRKPVPQPNLGNLQVRDGGFIAGDQPVVLSGVGHFGQARGDVPVLHGFGMNVIQIEIGPSATLPGPNEYGEQAVRDLLNVFRAAEQANVQINLLVSPHYCPQWAYEMYPEVKTCGRGFIQYCIQNPHARAVLEKHLAYLIPQVAGSPALNSYCLANEPQFAEYCHFSADGFTKWLQEKYGDIAALNATWSTKYGSFEALRQDIPNWGDQYETMKTSNLAMRYDWDVYHMNVGTEFFAWMKSVIRRYDPKTPVHVKFMSGAFNYELNQEGIDREALGELCEISGNDCGLGWPDNRYAMDWLREASFFDFLKSVQPGKPIFNSENHTFGDGADPSYPPEYFRAALAEGFLHGQMASTMWVWERVMGYTTFMWQPELVEAMGRISLDGMRLAPYFLAFSNESSPVALMQSTASRFAGVEHPNALDSVYEAMAFLNLPVRFITEKQLAEGGWLDRYQVVVVPAANYTPESAFAALEKFVRGGGTVVLFDDCFTYDEHGLRRTSSGLVQEGTEYGYGSGRVFRFSTEALVGEKEALLAKAYQAAGVAPPLRFVGSETFGVHGVEMRSASVNGKMAFYLLNLKQYPADLPPLEGVPAGATLHELIDNQRYPGDHRFHLEPLELRIVQVE